MENYNIYDEIGRGTHSFVYKARRKRSIEYVAVKSTAKCRMEKILNEVQLLHKLDSRYVLKFFNWYESQNHIWLIFEFCIGGDLLNLITQDKSLPEPAVKLFGSELVAGLQYLHANSILFCDLKPANILIDEFGSLKLADFGLARRIPSKETNTSAPLAPGSPNYMAPELFHQPAIHSFASDFWALGCVLYELCVGRQPFTHTNFSELARMIQTDKLELPAPGCDMCPSFWSLLERLLEKDPYKRITWDELIDHPFWTGLPPLAKLPMPQQELFASASRLTRRVKESSSASSPKPESSSVHQNNQQSGDTDAKSIHQDVETKSTETTSRSSSSSTTEGADEEDDGDSSRSDEDEEGEEELEDLSLFQQSKPALRPVTAPVKATGSSRQSARPSQHIEPKSDERPQAPTNKSRLQRNLSRGILESDSDTRMETPPPSRVRAPRTAPAAPMRRAPARSQIRFDGIFDRDGKPGAGLKKASKLMFTAADSAVKPIVYSDEIEMISTPVVRTEELRFQTMSADELLSCNTERLENHLKEVYLSLKSSQASATEKCSVLGYLFTLCLHSKLANVIVNSSILAMLARMVSSLASTSTTAASIAVLPVVCLDLGVMFRFATFIAPSSPEQLQALVSTLTQVTREAPNGRFAKTEDDRKARQLTRRRSLSCLGELLFYVSTQKDWDFPVAGLECVIDLLDDQDLVLRHYAARTVCNMLIHCTGTLLRPLVSEQVATLLVKGLVQLSTENDDISLTSLRITTAQAIAQLVRHLRTPSSLSQIPARTRATIFLLISKLNVLQAIWLGIAGKQPSCELAIASFNILNSVLELKTTDRGNEDNRDLAAVEAGKAALLERVSSFSVLATILEKRSRYEDDSQQHGAHTVQDSAARDDANGASGHRRRYAQEESGVPNLLRAKAMLFIHLGVQLNKPFASGCIQLRFLDLVDRTLLPFASQLRRQPDANGDGTSLTSSMSTSQTDVSSSSSPTSTSGSHSRHSRMSAVDVYMLQCALNLVKISIRTALKLSADCISTHDSDDAIEDRAHSRQTVSSAPFHLFDSVLRNPMCKAQLVSYFVANEGKEYTFFLRLMAKLLVTFPNETLSSGSEDTKVAVAVSEILLRLFQGTGSEVDALLSVEVEVLFTQLLPAVALQLHGTTTDAGDFEEDLHANCIRIMYVALLHCDYDIADSEKQLRDALIKEHLLPCFRSLLTSSGMNENVWRFAIELLFGLVSRDSLLLKEIDAAELTEPVIALLKAPQQLDFHSLPSSATKLVKMLVDSKKATLDELYAKGIVEALLAGLEFAGSEMLVASLSDLLAALYQLLFGRYEKLRKAGRSPPAAPLKFEKLVFCGPLIIKLCAARQQQQGAQSPQPQESPSKVCKSTNSQHEESADDDVAELASRCLLYLSQIFGEKLNDVIFTRSKQQKTDDAVARAVLTSLELNTPESIVVLRVLLTLKNCLRCQTNNARVGRWLVENARLHQKVKSMSAAGGGGKGAASKLPSVKSASKEPANTTKEQTAKTAGDIIRLCHSSASSSSSGTA